MQHGGDPFEGSSPRFIPDIREQAIMQQGGDVEAFRRQNAAFHAQMLQTILVNCWHKREYESRPMWERYGRGEPAVAMVTTLQDLIMGMPEPVTVGHVEYADLETDQRFTANLRQRAFMKSRDLEDEREVRAVLVDGPITENGRWRIEIKPGEEIGYRVKVDFARILQSAVLSTRHIEGVVSKCLADAHLNIPVALSTAAREVRY